MQLIIISHPENFHAEHELLLHLFDAGLESFHLRKPGSSAEDYKRYMDTIPDIYHKHIIIHRHISLYNEYNLKGVHFSSGNKHKTNEFMQEGIQKSISCHSFDELLKLQGFQYAFLSPVFDSISKENYKSRFSEEEITAFFKQNKTDAKVIALGGISSENIEKTLLMGFDGAAVMGTLWNNYITDKNTDKTVNYFIELNRKCRQFVRMY